MMSSPREACVVDACEGGVDARLTGRRHHLCEIERISTSRPQHA